MVNSLDNVKDDGADLSKYDKLKKEIEELRNGNFSDDSIDKDLFNNELTETLKNELLDLKYDDIDALISSLPDIIQIDNKDMFESVQKLRSCLEDVKGEIFGKNFTIDGIKLECVDGSAWDILENNYKNLKSITISGTKYQNKYDFYGPSFEDDGEKKGCILYNNRIYVGELDGGIAGGKGCMLHNNGLADTGTFENGALNGKGKSEHNGYFSEGNFEHGMLKGKGKITRKNGNILEGSFDQGEIETNKEVIFYSKDIKSSPCNLERDKKNAWRKVKGENKWVSPKDGSISQVGSS